MSFFSGVALLLAVAFAQKNMCARYQSYSSGGYSIQNDNWGETSAIFGFQCSSFDSVSNSGVAWSTTWQWWGDENAVKSYAHSARNFIKKPVAQIFSIPTTATWSISNENIRADVSYDLFTAADVNHSASSGDFEMMVWLGRFGNVDPVGSLKITVDIGDFTWDLWIGLNGNMQVYSFVAEGIPVTNFTGNVKDFFNYITIHHGFPADTQNLISESDKFSGEAAIEKLIESRPALQFGTESFVGGTTMFDVARWSADVE